MSGQPGVRSTDLPRRARCTYCGKTYAVTPATGVIRKHYVSASIYSSTVKPGTRVVCGGSGRQA